VASRSSSPTKYHDFNTETEFQRNLSWYTQRFVIFPEQLMSLSLTISLDWKRLQFNAANKKKVSQKRGVYAFVIQHDDSNLPQHGYITYIGITGFDSSDRNLQKRYQEYLRDQERPKRPPIHNMLNKWKECLYFHFAEVEDETVDLKDMEKKLSGAVIPPYSTNDFEADIRQAKGIWEKS